mgnify:FL=1
MADFARLIPPMPFGFDEDEAGSALLEVLESAQRLVAYCDNDSVGGTDHAELAGLGLPTAKLRHALSDLRRSVRQMNRTLASEDGCALLANLRPARLERHVA